MAIITTPSSAEMVPLHNRMPLVVEHADCPAWLSEVESDPLELLRPAPGGTRHAWPVSRTVNSPRNNGPELIEAIKT